MHVERRAKTFIVLFAVLFTAAVFLNSIVVQADYTVPEKIRVGLNYGSTAINNFTLKSDSGITVEVLENGAYINILSFMDVTGIKIRKDAYYIVKDGIAAEINYVRAATYDGELIGPYHIQIGEAFATLEEAKQLAAQAESIAPSVFIAYEGGWKVWTQLFPEESNCQQQIEVLKNELGGHNYYIIRPDIRRVQLLDPVTGKVLFVLNGEQHIRVSAISKENTQKLIELGVSKYRGSIYFARLADSDINVYNELTLDEYLYGVVPKEMPASWHVEALKAQAVAARCYAVNSINRHSSHGFDLCNTQHCQVYMGYSGENVNTNKAVDETKGKVVVYNGKIITAYFSSTSGGRTENSENYWSAAVPYLRAVDDSYEVSPHSNWEKPLNKDEIKAKLAAKNVDIGDILDIIPLSYSENGRVLSLKIIGTKGEKTYEKEGIRTVLGYSDLKSTWFTVQSDADVYIKSSTNTSAVINKLSNMYVKSAGGVGKLNEPTNKAHVKSSTLTATYNIVPYMYTFRGRGYGHGLGLSQYGAKGMAEAGFNYIQILEHYFTGAKVQ
ncbi:MAG: SpoIID/LytB domain-containing protein [Bacillota bacterium]